MLKFGVTRSTRSLNFKASSKYAASLRPSLSYNMSAGSISSAVFGVRYNSSAPTSEIKNKLTDFSAENSSVVSDMVTTTMRSDELGYMASIGLGEGWGPTALITNILEITHVYTGLPWWASIVCATFAVRTMMFPLYVKSSANMAKMSRVKPQVDQLMNEMRSGTNSEKMAAMSQRNKLYKENDIKTLHSFLPMLQLPIAYGFFQATRNMANFPVEGFTTQGAYWFENLTQADPYLGLQILTALVVTGMMRGGGETGAQTMNPMVKKVMTYLPFLSIFVTYNLSASVLVYFAANAVFSFFQSLILKNKHFRKFAAIPPIQPPITVPGGKAPPASVSEWWNEYNSNLKKQARSKMEQTNKKLEAMESRRQNKGDGFIKRH
ncbi:hypothetical protein METBIDRAFT_30267 [Metschnikowia bicuspidata var. bicuspidata NRRL YB-4993]|uniref:Membrane insertase YidC/Oxa/ALB C-terminal domain-containing protein n=1 Tax=Metschnikowia bicuspidata var. bicuspidata NRRL YB-4993 TaxID=869754 RepID=A0A1A0HIR3_9ASCO|nr:hypothetical protein METBIDRAFT_30267 [Metschnikowia bicuspidata var. bicuspidata NRRL YB-4993]OBA23900.1 hypothetical protein METBIDRAFT_30267 [Metschnikowia bicuspidata var. bicuspidata NRRL YB-4993]